MTQLQNGTFSSSGTVVIDGLKSDTEYEVNITAECVEIEDVDSDSLSMEFTTISEYMLYIHIHAYVHTYLELPTYSVTRIIRQTA